MPATTHRTTTAVSIAYDSAGSGEPALLMMAGWCAPRSVYRKLVPLTSRTRRTLVFDWRGHGDSTVPAGEYGDERLLEDALAVVEASGARRVVPVAAAQSGWVAIRLLKELGLKRVSRLVLIDWPVLVPPPDFLATLQALRDPAQWHATRDGLFDVWLAGVEDPDVIRYVREEMGAVDAAMWARSSREIGVAYRRNGSPLAALAALDEPVPVLHLYAQPADPGFLAEQEAFAKEHPWFSVRRLAAKSHFPMLEVPDTVAREIERFVAH